MDDASARDLRRAAARFRAPAALPRLWFFTDPVRTPEPWRIAPQLPAGAAVVYRHFDAADRRQIGRRLRRVCERNGLCLLVGADWALAEELGAAGVHLPERLGGEAQRLKASRPHWIVTMATHSARSVQNATADAVVLSPVFPSRSPSAGAPLGLAGAARIARMAQRPVIALGGVRRAHLADLARAGFAGAAGIDLFVG